MKAAVLREVGKPFTIEEVEVDNPGPREVLVRTAFAGLCHSDMHFQEGLYPCATPIVLGHEGAGIVEAVGSDVGYVQPGDHVITCVSIFCGQCKQCLSGNPHRCSKEGVTRTASDPPRLRQPGGDMHQFMELSCFGEQMLVHENAVVKITKDIPLDRAALIGCGVTTGVGAVLNTAKVGPGSTVAVVGCGGIGLNALQGARLAGAERIIAVDRIASKLELAGRFGATDVVDASNGDPVAQVQELTGGGVDYSFEAIGLKETAEQCFAMLAPGGTATVIGMIPLGTKIELHGVDLLSEKKIQGSNMGSNRFRTDMPTYIQLYLQGRLELDQLLSQHLQLDEINEGFEAIKGGEVARSVLVMEA
ncbi:MAG: Zn-dependent alcohol dehydrogenase [Deltaproteobacteria bacterium]|nr:Zn-dependent alcohol dehydrogenase [Deltaproteobacteria bacterium]MBW2363199.1 Zn-dependent alcohol dehydrogenase [Deltaproteobacteria bacterium]